jgi:hypothetical protein
MTTSNASGIGLRLRALARACAGLLLAAPAFAYPGGTPEFQTDVIPYCAACHSSTAADALLGAAGDRADKEVAEQKHLATILAGAKPYDTLSESDRGKLVELIKTVDANSTIELDFPPQVAPGETFQVTARLSGGAGPVVGVALVDQPHRWFARPASAAGWEIVGAPTVIGPAGKPQTEWLSRRPERFGRNITFVNVTGWKSDATTGSWAKAKVIFTLKAPERHGDYPLVGVFFYGTEKAIPMSTVANPMYGDQPLGGYTGKSGRVKFTTAHVVSVK